jgi:hypothetical protein
VIYNNFGLVAPDIIEHVHHDVDGLVPNQLIISLVVKFGLVRRRRRTELSKRTSENAGATIFLYFFLFIPKTTDATYRSTGLGDLARDVVISYVLRVGGGV